MKLSWKTLRPIRSLLIGSLALFWGLSFLPKTQVLAARSALLKPPKIAIGWADGALVVARAASIPRREQVSPVKWARCGFRYEHFDFDRAQPPYTPSPVTFKAYDFKAARVPFWFLVVLVVLPTLAAKLYRVYKANRRDNGQVQPTGGGVA